MILRIVKMKFKEDKVDEFLHLFHSRSHLIRAFDGCLHLDLLRDCHNPCVLFTFSHWLTESHLEAYRNSPLFLDTWTETKSFFEHKAEAWTVVKVDGL